MVHISWELFDTAAGYPSKYADFIRERNRRWNEFIRKTLPRQQVKKDRSDEKIVPTPNYSLEDVLIELHDHLKENFGHDFQFTGLSTLAAFLHNAYSKIIYNIQTVNGAGQELLEAIADHTEKFVVLLDPKPSEIEATVKISKENKIIIIREYAERLPTTWAMPEKAWLDLCVEVKKNKITQYGDELITVLAELLESNLTNPKKLRTLARHRKLSNMIETYLESE